MCVCGCVCGCVCVCVCVRARAFVCMYHVGRRRVARLEPAVRATSSGLGQRQGTTLCACMSVAGKHPVAQATCEEPLSGVGTLVPAQLNVHKVVHVLQHLVLCLQALRLSLCESSMAIKACAPPRPV